MKVYAIEFTDKLKSAKFTTFFDSMDLRRYLLSNTVIDNTGVYKTAELLALYNQQNGSLIEVQ